MNLNQVIAVGVIVGVTVGAALGAVINVLTGCGWLS